MAKHLSTSIIGTIVVGALALPILALADSSRGRGALPPGTDRRDEALTKVLGILEDRAPDQANSPNAVADALANTPPNDNANNGQDGDSGDTPEATAQGADGNNGGTSSGNGGNGGAAAAGGVVRAASVVSNAHALNVLNAVLIRLRQ